jgi:hypothetical protein
MYKNNIHIYIMDKILIIIVSILIILFNSYYKSGFEGFTSYNLAEATGKIPESETNVLVQDSYPITGINGISNNGASDIWWWYPALKIGSYKQITNNIRYPYRPSDGRCTPASMCGALYKKNDNFIGKNDVKQLPPVGNCGTRVGYFNSAVL